MKAHLIDTHLLVPRSRSSAKVKVKYQGHVSQKMGVSGALVFYKHILFDTVLILYSTDMHQQQTAFENIMGKEEIALDEQFLFPQCFLLLAENCIPICQYF